MRRYLAVFVVVLLALAAPAQAGSTTQRGSYTVQVRPDPTAYVGDTTGRRCTTAGGTTHVGRVPDESHRRDFRFASAGDFEVVLQPELAVFPVGPEWDLLLRSGRHVLAQGQPKWGDYRLSYRVPAAAVPLTVVVCTKSGALNATVHWAFTPR